jgi:exonuclease 3'-5' domain-containing protein 1
MFRMKDVEAEIIDTTEQVGALVDWLVFRHAPPAPHSPTMYLDLEGVDLCRYGSISILTLLINTGATVERVCLIDVHTLGAQAFKTAGAEGKTLQDVLQDGKLPKVFFDARNDSDALYAHFGIALQGVEDIQLMESATRKTTTSRKFLNGLKQCVEDMEPSNTGRNQLAGWKLAKRKGEQLFKAELGGSYNVFNIRPLPGDIISYCTGDVNYLPELRDRFWAGRTNQWRELVVEETKKRIAASQKPEYQPYGKHRAIAPWTEIQNVYLDQWNYVPSRSVQDYDDWVENGPMEYGDEDDEYYDDGPTSCRDIISERDYDLYYSD